MKNCQHSKTFRHVTIVTMENINWNLKIQEAVDRTEFMAISTTDEHGSWTNPVQYGYSEKFDLYFVSMLDAKHVKNILKNPRVSGAIYKTERFPGSEGNVMGLQFKGNAYHITDNNEINEAVGYYGSKPSEVWNFFKIIPEELWCFDSRVFGEKRVNVDLETLKLIRS
jgi:uncharacterized protein YhbP (UPF0306 family)